MNDTGNLLQAMRNIGRYNESELGSSRTELEWVDSTGERAPANLEWCPDAWLCDIESPELGRQRDTDQGAGDDASGSRKNGLILVIDDDLSSHAAIQLMLEPLQCRLIFTNSGPAGLAAARKELPDLIILDIMMPEMDGFEVCRSLRADQRLAEVPVIVVTSLGDRTTLLKALDAGADEFLTRPLDDDEIRTRVRTILRLNRYRHLVIERQKLDRILQLAPDGFLLLDDKRNILQTNQAMLRMLGAQREDILGGTKVESIVPKDLHETFFASLGQVLSENKTLPWVETELLTLKGERLSVELTASCFLWGGNKTLQLFIRDVSEKRKLQEQFLRSQRLNHLGTVASGIAHDLNNVLTPILGAVPLVRNLGNSPSGNRMLDVIEASARRGAGVIQQILTFARGREGERADVNLKYLLKELEDLITKTFPSNISVRSSVDENLKMVTGDQTQLHQVLMNLCVNARDAMADGGYLAIRLETIFVQELDTHWVDDAKPGEYVRIAVSDTGVGITPEVMAQLFEPFFTTKPFGKGTGLGLAAVRGIVKAHKGFVQVETALGKGSTFSVYLPASQKVAERNPFKPRNALPRGDGELVLVVDDEAGIREVLSRTLETSGYRAISAANGADAVSRFIENRKEIRAVLTDLMMPELDGRGLINVIRRLDAKLPIIILSSQHNLERNNLLNGEDVHFLEKPFSSEVFLTLLGQVLKKQTNETTMLVKC